jgi:anti-sigma factor RsiW
MNHLADETLNLYLDDLLDSPARQVAEEHLAGCASCQAQLGLLRSLFFRLEALPIEPIPVDLMAAVIARIEPTPQPHRARIALGLLATQTALTIFLALWLAPTFNVWTSTQRLAFPTGLIAGLPNTFTPQLAISWTMLADMGSSVGMPGSPFEHTSPAQLVLFIAAVAVIWLIGNRLLLVGLNASGDRRQEAA